MKRLYRMLDRSTEILEEGFSFTLEGNEELLDRLRHEFGEEKLYASMTKWMCEKYATKFKEEFILTERCMAKELKFHVDAYMYAMGYRGYHRSLFALPFTKEKLIRHCRSVEISTEDFTDLRQRIVFGYRRGIRKGYRERAKALFRKQNHN